MMGPRLTRNVMTLIMVMGSSLVAQPCPPYLVAAARYDVESWNLLPGTGHTEVVGDLDGRLGPDFVQAAPGGLGIQVFLNNGGGVLQRTWVPTQLPNVTGAALGDFDHDGDLDLVVVGPGYAPLFFQNDSRGTLTQEATGLRIPGNLDAKSVAAADFDGDGWTDLFVGMVDPYPSRIYLNDRAGRFVDSTATHLTSPVFGCVHHAVAKDVDLDGDVDLVLAMGGNCGPQQENLILRNDGQGHLTPVALTGRRGWSLVVAIGDLDGNGLPDLLFGNTGGPSELWLNQGGGLFSDASSRLPGNIVTILSATILDVDRDGWNDLVMGLGYAGASSYTVDTYRNVGAATFVRDSTAIRQSGVMPLSMDNADFDRDCDDDVVIAGNVPLPPPFRAGLRVLMNTSRHVLPTDAPTLGQSWQIDLLAAPNQLVFPAVAAAPTDVAIPLLGVLGLDPASMVVLPFVDMRATCQQTLTLAIPNNPWLRGRPVYCQTYVLDPQNPAASHLTNWTVDTFR